MTRLLAGCLLFFVTVSAADGEQANKPGQGRADTGVAFASSAREGFQLERGAHFAWRVPAIWIENDAIPLSKSFTVEDVHFSIQRQLAAMDIVFVDPNESHYDIVAAVVVGHEDEAQRIAELVDLYPSLDASQQHDAGTLLIAISRPGHPELLWQASGEVFFLQDEATEEQIIQRFNQLVSSLLDSVPLE